LSPLATRRALAVGVALAVAAVAVAFRLVRLESVPPGLYVDELLTAGNAIAWRLAADPDWLGSRPLVAAGWVETSNLYLAFASTVLRLFGDGLPGIRMVSVLPSLAAVPLLYLLGREVAGRRVGALAAFLLAASQWAARSGRTGWDQVLMVALHLGALALLARALRRDRLLPAAAAGALLGVGLHTYVAARLAALHGAIWQLWEVPLASNRKRAIARLVLVAALVGLLALPLLRRPDAGGQQRVRDLAVWQLEGPGEPWATLSRNVGAHLAMFHVRGGAYARDALPRWPMFDPVSGVLLLAGVVAVARRAGWQRRLLLGWPAVVVLGGVLSVSGEGPPYPYRVTSLAAWGCLVAALGGVALWDRVAGARPRLARTAAAAALLAAVAWNGWVLFVGGPRYPGSRLVYGTTETQVGLWLRDHRLGRPSLIHRDVFTPLPVAPFPHAGANRQSFFRPVDSIAAVQLVAGIWRQRPERSLDPLARGGDVDLVDRWPAGVAGPAVLVAGPGSGAAAAHSRWPQARPTELRHPDGTLLAVVFEVAPLP
jgi:4-amino-4-deoxy-L-arabinose transferase-like glycosyltransferase